MSDKLYTLITGGSQGIGKALAGECASRGMDLLLVALPTPELNETADELRNEYGISVDCLGIDLTAKESPREVFDWCQKKGCRVNILINNAGMAGTAEFDVSSLEYSDQRIHVNIRALALLTQLFVPEMKKLESAYVLNIGSMAGFSGVPYKSIYSASKAFVIELTRALRYELKDTPIKFCVVCPSGIRSGDATGERIEAHGFIGRLTEISMEKLASISIGKLLKGRMLIIPGFVNKFIFYFGRMFPKRLIMNLLTKEFKKELSVRKGTDDRNRRNKGDDPE
jgi:short-subunit dehydrogenase